MTRREEEHASELVGRDGPEFERYVLTERRWINSSSTGRGELLYLRCHTLGHGQ